MGARELTALAALLWTAVLCAPAPALTARELLDQAKQLDDTTRHWTDRTQRMSLDIFTARGDQRRRELVAYTKRYPGGEEKSISFILVGAEVKGVGLLQWAHKGRDDEQWLYLPELKRTRQVAARLRDESFVGTAFTYRDLEILGELLHWSEDEAATKLLGEDPVGGHPCHMIELRPQQEDVPYPRIVVWMDGERLTPRKLDFFDRSGTRVKGLTLDDVRDLGAIPTAHRLEMQTLTTGSHTLVTLTEVAYSTGLADDLFTQRQLERGAP